MIEINFPDVLGFITGGLRQQTGGIQAALALRPRIVRPGQAFEVVALLQNTGSAPVSVSAALHLPEADAHRMKGRFVARAARVVAELLPGEVGYLSLPCACHPETAPANGYKLTLELDSKTSGKSERLRASDGGGAFDPERVAPELRRVIEGLQDLDYSVGRGGRLETTFGVSPSGSGRTVSELKPGWVSVCKLTDLNDDRVLLYSCGKLFQVEALPTLKRVPLLDMLTRTTAERFAAAGITLLDAEARLIAKLMTLIVEYANPRTTQHGYQAAGRFAITPLLARPPWELETPDLLPHWGRALLRLIARDARAAPGAPQVIERVIYDDLLRDAVEWGFELVESATGEDIGSEAERREYADRLIAALDSKSGVTFSQVYLPLVMGGILINDSLLMEREDPAELLKGASHALEGRTASLEENDLPLQEMTDVLLERTAQKYGYKLN